MKLNQRQIDIFNAIMTNKSMTAAAGAVGTSQPTISREIRELEQRIGFELFLRFGKRLTPTDQAVLLHEVVRRSFVGLDEISRAASAICTRNAGTFRIASIPALAESIVPRVIQRFLKARPAVHFTIHSHEEPSLRHEMTTQVFDLGLTEDKFERDDATIETIPVADMVCVLPARHRLAARMVLEPDDFAGESFVHFEQNDPYRRKLDEVFVAAGVVRSCRGDDHRRQRLRHGQHGRRSLGHQSTDGGQPWRAKRRLPQAERLGTLRSLDLASEAKQPCRADRESGRRREGGRR